MAKATATRGSHGQRRFSLAIVAAGRLSEVSPANGPPDFLAAAVLAALEAALEALRAPALIVGQRGEIICSNAPARVLVGSGASLTRGLAVANAVGGPSQRWDVTPIRRAGPRGWALAVLRTLDAPARPRWDFTGRQREVLDLIVRGLTNSAIAETLGIRLGTVEFHISAIFDKVGVNSRAALIATVMGR